MTSDDVMTLPSVDEPVTLTVWAWEGTGHAALLEEYDRSNSEVAIRLVLADLDEHHAGLSDALDANGDVPDVAALEATYLPSFLERADRFVDLAELGLGSLEQDHVGWRWRQGVSANGKIIGVPTDVGGMAIAYRRDLFASAGLPSDPGAVAKLWPTWEKFLEVGRTYVEASDGQFVDGATSVFRARMAQGATGYTDGAGTLLLGDDSDLRRAFDSAATTVASDLALGAPQFTPEWNEGLREGKFAVLVAPAWMRGYLASRAPETIGEWGLVAAPGGAGNSGGTQLAIPADAQHKDEAAKLIRFLAAAPQQLEAFKSSGNLPSDKALQAGAELASWSDPFYGGQAVGPVYTRSVQQAPAAIIAPGEHQLAAIVASTLTDLADSRHESPDGAWTAMMAELSAEVMSS